MRRPVPSRAARGLLGAGALGLAATLALGTTVSASADSDEPSAEPTSESLPGESSAAPSGAASESPAATPSTTPVPGPVTDAKPKASSDEAQTQQLAPNYGSQKYRVGVQVADGSFVPAGTTTVGSKIRVVEKGPNVPDGKQTFTCTTDAFTVQAGSTASYCTGGISRPAGAKAVEDGDSSIPFYELYTARAGSTVTLTQVTATENLALDTTISPATIKPCTIDENDGDGACDGNGANDEKVTSVTFEDPGLPPVARNDSATTDPSTAVDVDVLANDSDGNGAPLTGLDVVSGPGHGTATVQDPPEGPSRIAGPGSILYEPAAGFTGTDTFRYRIRTQNGTSIATVRVVVPGGTPSTPSAQNPRPAALPDAGGPDGRLLGLGLGLLGAGGALSLFGRRRRGAVTPD